MTQVMRYPTTVRRMILKTKLNCVPEKKRCPEKFVSSRLSDRSPDCTCVFVCCLFVLAWQPPVGKGLFIHEVYRSQTTAHNIRLDPSGRMISTHNRKTSVPPVWFEPTTPASHPMPRFSPRQGPGDKPQLGVIRIPWPKPCGGTHRNLV